MTNEVTIINNQIVTEDRYFRTALQIDEDYHHTCRLLLEGNTWNQVAMSINKNRPYNFPVSTYATIYRKRLKDAGMQRVVEDELQRAIDDMDVMMQKCMREFEKSKNPLITVTKTYVKNPPARMNIKGELELIEEKYTISEKKIKKVKSGAEHKYLDLWLKFREKKDKYLNLGRAETQDINVFLSAHTLDDDNGGYKAPAVLSEEQARILGQQMGE